MNKHVFNGSLLAGWALVSTGAGLVYLPAGLVTAGVLLIALTLTAARIAARPR